jgi:hypothetical protein
MLAPNLTSLMCPIANRGGLLPSLRTKGLTLKSFCVQPLSLHRR